jgi:amidase
MSIDRRTFIRNSAVLGVAAGAASFPAGAAASTPVSAGADAPGPFELDELTVADLQKRMQSGQDTAKSLVQKYLGRIERLDTRDPALRYMIEINPEALAIAEALDVERRKTGPRGSLHGVPVLIKDNIGTADRMTTTAGSLALEGSIPAKDSFVAARLREAGAVILGKTNLSEWANFRSTRSSSGWSARGGQAKNPYALDRNPSGSSSGTGGAVAANYGAVGLGSETDGSVT